jgi:poly(3-hydroxybutyrate) depolymerase
MENGGFGVKGILNLFALVAMFTYSAIAAASVPNANAPFTKPSHDVDYIKIAAADITSAPISSGIRDTAQALSQSELLAMRSRLAQLWKLKPNVDHPEQLFVTIRVRLNRDHRLAAPPQIVSTGNSPQYHEAAQAAVQAVVQGQPYTMLQDETYDHWKYMDIDFDPAQNLAK